MHKGQCNLHLKNQDRRRTETFISVYVTEKNRDKAGVYEKNLRFLNRNANEIA